MAASVKSICFICLANTCRSPLAEGIFNHLLVEMGKPEQFAASSAAATGITVGQLPDPRAQTVALAHGITLAHRARQFVPEDFAAYGLVLTLDRNVNRIVEQMAPSEESHQKIRLLRPHDPQAQGSQDVPDPYHGDLAAYEQTYQILERSIRGLLADLISPSESHGQEKDGGDPEGNPQGTSTI